jgi:hypothetical protein
VCYGVTKKTFVRGSTPRTRLTFKYIKMSSLTMGTSMQKNVPSTTTKFVEATKLTKYEKITAKFEALKIKEKKTITEVRSLMSAYLQLEDKTPSAIFNKLKKSYDKSSEISNEVKLALGKSKFPTFQEFITKLTAKNKQWYSNWDGIIVLTSFNKVAKINTKVKNQNKKESAK